ncbi:conserved hypothetical protein, partial [Trichinella spiralis]
YYLTKCHQIVRGKED